MTTKAETQKRESERQENSWQGSDRQAQQGADRQSISGRQDASEGIGRDAAFNENRQDPDDGGRQDNTRHSTGLPMGAGPSTKPQINHLEQESSPAQRHSKPAKQYSENPRHVGRQTTGRQSQKREASRQPAREEKEPINQASLGNPMTTVMRFRDDRHVVCDDAEEYYLIDVSSPQRDPKDAKRLDQSTVNLLLSSVEGGSLQPDEMSFEQACRQVGLSAPERRNFPSPVLYQADSRDFDRGDRE